jgi:hypothetical protein
VKVLVATVAAIAALAASGIALAAGGGSAAAASRARLIPTGFAPFKVKGMRFHAHERVHLTVTPSTGDRIVRRILATRRGTFVVSFPGVESCGGVSGVATGSRGSHASFQFSSVVCP